jgi:bifunctional ADP-heptose synthase (sugar kinase/adenylyltransferase)
MIEPTVLIKGGDWQGNVVGQEFVEFYGGTVKIFPIEGTNSTTNIIKKCQQAC